MELNQRLFLIRNCLLDSCSEEDNTLITRVFRMPLFQKFQAFTPRQGQSMTQQQLLMDMKKDQTFETSQCIEKFGKFFIKEYKHFIDLYADINMRKQMSEQVSAESLDYLPVPNNDQNGYKNGQKRPIGAIYPDVL